MSSSMLDYLPPLCRDGSPKDEQVKTLKCLRCEVTDLKRRVKRLEKQMADEVARLKAFKDAVDAHNQADTQFQADVNAKIADLKAQIEAGDLTAIDAALNDLKASLDAQPMLTLPA